MPIQFWITLMRLEIRERPYDLYGVIAASTALMLVLLIVPDITSLRVILGLPFILFFPGYALISALYPEKQRVIGEYPEEEEKPQEEMTKAEKRDLRRRRSERRREEQGRGNSDDTEEDEEPPETKGLDGLERVALSLGLSIAITPLIGLVLNYTYDWDPEHLGIRLVPIFVSQFAFITITSIVAVYRRNKVPIEDRFEIVLDISIPEDYTTMDKVLTVGIVVMMVLSVGLLIYIIVVPREGESFTEFYVLGSGGMADEYPRYFTTDDPQSIFIGIGNHEHEDLNYTLFMTIDDDAENESVVSMDNVTISRTGQPLTEVDVNDGETVEIPCNFTITDPGSYKLRLLLYLNGEEYRDLHLWVKVFSPGHFRSMDGGSTLVYLTGVRGDPSKVMEPINDDYMGLTVNIVSSVAPDYDVALEINGSEQGTYKEMVPAILATGEGTLEAWTGNVSRTESSRTDIRINETEVGRSLLVDLDPALDTLMIKLRSSAWSVEFTLDADEGVGSRT